MKKAIFLQPAEQEMLESAQYYESQAKGLGSAFLNEIQRSMMFRIKGLPEFKR